MKNSEQTQSSDSVPRLVRVFVAPEDDEPHITIGRALRVWAAWPDPVTGEMATPQTVWNWIDIAIGGRKARRWEPAERGEFFIANNIYSYDRAECDQEAEA